MMKQRFALLLVLNSLFMVSAFAATEPKIYAVDPQSSDPVSAGLSLADQCSPMNLYEDPKNPLHRIPIVHQGPSDTCYAQTSAQMIDYYRMSQNSNAVPVISAQWIALNHKTIRKIPRRWVQWAKNSLGNAYMRWAIQDFRSMGNCSLNRVNQLMKDLHSELSIQTPLSVDELLYLLETVWPKVGIMSASQTTDIAEWVKSDEELVYFDELLKENHRLPLEILLQDLLKSPIIAAHKSQYYKVIQFFQFHVFAACEVNTLEEVKLPEPKSRAIGFVGNRALGSLLDDWLSQPGKQPVAVGYCAEIYENENGMDSDLYIPGLPRALRMVTTGCAAHYSLVVARRPSAEHGCDYLIRNSYGEDFWTKKWECLCEDKITGIQKSCRYSSSTPTPGANQRVLGCWAGRDELVPNMYDMEQFPVYEQQYDQEDNFQPE